MSGRLCLVVLTDNVRLVTPGYVRDLRRFGEVRIPENPRALGKVELAAILSESDVAVTGWESPLLPEPEPGWRLRYVCHMTGELRKYVPPAYFRSDIPVTNWGNAFSFATAEGAIALLFSVLKDTKGLDLQVREKGSVIGDTPHICSLHGARVGIYGLSSIGRIVAERILPYGAEVLFYDPTITDVPPGLKRCGSLRDLFAGSDVVSIHTGLNDVTRHSVNGELLSLLPDGGILINTARGGIVVEEDLARILHTGRLRAGLDVIQHEDDWRTSLFVTTPNTVLTGHSMAYIGRAETTTLQSVAMDNIGRFAAGQALKHIVTEERFRLMT